MSEIEVDDIDDDDEPTLELPVDATVDASKAHTLEVRRRIEDMLEAKRFREEFDHDF